MTTVVVKTIGLGGDYSTLAAWEAAKPNDLVAADQVWQGKIKNASDVFTTSAGNILTVDGSTTDATRYTELTAATGASFIDNASASTNPLRYDNTKGCAIEATGSYSQAINVGENYFRMSRIQVKSAMTPGVVFNFGGTYATLSQLIVDVSATNGAGTFYYTTAKDCLFIQRGSTSYFNSSSQCNFLNCTFVSPTDDANTNVALAFSYSSGSVVANCAFFGQALGPTYNSATGIFNNCYTDYATPPSGFTTVGYNTTTGSGFNAITSAAADFRIKSTSALKGAAGASSTTTDILGTTRASPASVGAFEYAAAAPTGIQGTFTKSFAGATLSATGALKLQAVLSKTFASLALAATGTLKLQGLLSYSLSGATLAATGTLPIKGTLGGTFAPLTTLSTGKVVLSALGGGALDPLTVQASGTLPVKGVGAFSLDPLGVVSAGTLKITGVANGTFDALTLLASGVSTAFGSGVSSFTLDPLTLVATARLPIGGTSSLSFDALSLVATGSLPIAGIAFVSLDQLQIAASAASKISGNLGVTFDNLTAQGQSLSVSPGGAIILLDDLSLQASASLGIKGQAVVGLAGVSSLGYATTYQSPKVGSAFVRYLILSGVYSAR